jgi:hypothetical protein
MTLINTIFDCHQYPYNIKSQPLKKVMNKEIPQHTSHSAVYGLGLIGAAIYYISHAIGFWSGVLGFLKALVWPAFLVYEALKAFNA